MEVIINVLGDIVGSKRGIFYAGTKNIQLVRLLAQDNAFSGIPIQRRLVHINITRSDDQQSGWLLMDTIDKGESYFYKCQLWDLAVPGELKIVFKITDIQTEVYQTTAEAISIVRNGVIAQPVCPENHSVIESYYYELSNTSFRYYDCDLIDTYPIDFITDGYKTPKAIYTNFAHNVVNSVNVETGEKFYLSVQGVLMVASFTDNLGVIHQTETFFAQGRAWIRELEFEIITENEQKRYHLLNGISEFGQWGFGTVGPQGKSFTPCGEWNKEISYRNTLERIDVFYYEGSTYYTKKTAPNGTLPTDDEYFGIFIKPENFAQTTGESELLAMSQKASTEFFETKEDATTKLNTKLNKNVGIENAGKILIVGDNGEIIPSPLMLTRTTSEDGVITYNLGFGDEETEGGNTSE